MILTFDNTNFFNTFLIQIFKFNTNFGSSRPDVFLKRPFFST